MATSLDLEGVVCAGLGDGAMFTQLDWVMSAFRDKLGFVPHPGTFNLRVQGPAWDRARPMLLRQAGIGIAPADGFCAAKCFAVRIGGRLPGAAVFPDVADYPDDKLEIVAPVAVRQALGVRDGDRVSVLIEIV